MPDTPEEPSTGLPARERRRPSRLNTAPRPAPRLAADDRFFRYIVDGMRNGVIAFRRDGTVALMNDEAYRILGLTPQPGDLGRTFADLLRDRPTVVHALSATFEMTHLPNRAELRLKELGRVLGYTLSLVRDDLGVPIGAAIFFKDLTRVEQIEEQERLRDRLASLGEMAAGIAHELKNPLAGIEVMAGLLRRQVASSPDAQSILADIISEAQLANAIVVEMLEFVRPIRLQVERIDIAHILRQSISLAETKAPRGGVAMEMAIEPGTPLIDGDEHRLVQVFTNLLTNAFEALDGNGRVTITARTGAIVEDPALGGSEQPIPTLVVDVADSGPGVSAELADKIFDPFFTTKVQGTGLGLGIVRKIVDAHDGRIDIVSLPGEGARFSVTLPVTSISSWFK